MWLIISIYLYIYTCFITITKLLLLWYCSIHKHIHIVCVFISICIYIYMYMHRSEELEFVSMGQGGRVMTWSNSECLASWPAWVQEWADAYLCARQADVMSLTCGQQQVTWWLSDYLFVNSVSLLLNLDHDLDDLLASWIWGFCWIREG